MLNADSSTKGSFNFYEILNTVIKKNQEIYSKLGDALIRKYNYHDRDFLIPNMTVNLNIAGNRYLKIMKNLSRLCDFNEKTYSSYLKLPASNISVEIEQQSDFLSKIDEFSFNETSTMNAEINETKQIVAENFKKVVDDFKKIDHLAQDDITLTQEKIAKADEMIKNAYRKFLGIKLWRDKTAIDCAKFLKNELEKKITLINDFRSRVNMYFQWIEQVVKDLEKILDDLDHEISDLKKILKSGQELVDNHKKKDLTKEEAFRIMVENAAKNTYEKISSLKKYELPEKKDIHDTKFMI